jgi:Tol biopolymer transport system component
MVMNADGSGVTALGGGTASDGGQITSFSWSPDGDRVVFTRQISQGGHLISNLFVMSADGTDVSQLTNDGDSMRPSWSPDGSQIVFEVPSDDYHRRSIYVTDATGAGRTHLTDGPWTDGAPVWSPDGKHIAFVRVDGESSITFGIRSSSLMVMNADGTDQHVIVTAEEVNGSPTTPSWQPVAAQPSASPSASQVMSTSPAPSQAVKVPNVIGVSFKRARQLLADVGLKVGNVQVVTGAYTEAVVIQQSPSAGTAVDQGTSVDIVTGPGPAEASSG